MKAIGTAPIKEAERVETPDHGTIYEVEVTHGTSIAEMRYGDARTVVATVGMNRGRRDGPSDASTGIAASFNYMLNMSILGDENNRLRSR